MSGANYADQAYQAKTQQYQLRGKATWAANKQAEEILAAAGTVLKLPWVVKYIDPDSGDEYEIVISADIRLTQRGVPPEALEEVDDTAK